MLVLVVGEEHLESGAGHRSGRRSQWFTDEGGEALLYFFDPGSLREIGIFPAADEPRHHRSNPTFANRAWKRGSPCRKRNSGSRR